MFEKKARIIALYLPKYHPIQENNEWWGVGFTEWNNVVKAKPLFKGHYQPHIPADLGFYDLRVPEVRKHQARLAEEAGIEGFCYWHYWFMGKQLLEKPFEDVLSSGEPDFPFCLAWANHSWTRDTWTQQKSLAKSSILIKQEYSEQDHINHFYHLLPAFKDKRYICHNELPVFVIYDPYDIPDVSKFILLWKDLAKQNGLKGIHFIGQTSNIRFKNVLDNNDSVKKIFPDTNGAWDYYQYILDMKFDAVLSNGALRSEILSTGKFKTLVQILLKKFFGISVLKKLNYSKVVSNLFVDQDSFENIYPMIIPNSDRSPRSGRKAKIYINSTPTEFEKCVIKAIEVVKNKRNENKIVFLKSWNEWGEGNYVEPDEKYKHGYLDALKKVLF